VGNRIQERATTLALQDGQGQPLAGLKLDCGLASLGVDGQDAPRLFEAAKTALKS
jgi:hypothetical protein